MITLTLGDPRPHRWRGPRRRTRREAVLVDGVVTTDSRDCGPGSLYVARVGEHADGHDYVGRGVRARRGRRARRPGPSTACPASWSATCRPPSAGRPWGRRPGPGAPRRRHHRLVGQDQRPRTCSPRCCPSVAETVAPVGLAQRRDRRAADGLPRHSDDPLPGRRDGRPGHRPHRLPHRHRAAAGRHRPQRRHRPRRRVRLTGATSPSPRPSCRRRARRGPRDPQRRRPRSSRPWPSRLACRVQLVGLSPEAEVRAEDVVLDDLGRAASASSPPGAARESRCAPAAAPRRATRSPRPPPPSSSASPRAGRCRSATAEPASPWRMEVTERADGVVVVNDAYNANPDSMRAALDAAGRAWPCTRPAGWAVLGEMLELGDDSAAEHARVGAYAARLASTGCGRGRGGPAASRRRSRGDDFGCPTPTPPTALIQRRSRPVMSCC